jgi:uncharacterized protein (TIGR02270 family)
MTVATPSPSHVEIVVWQHAEETAFLWSQRTHLATAPHVAVRHLARWDDRLAAHIDGLRVAGEAGWKICQAQLATEAPGEMFAAMIMALEAKKTERIDKLFALTKSVPDMRPGLLSAFGWISAQFLQGTVKELLASPSPFRRLIAISCCAMHRVDPGQAIDDSIKDKDPLLRTRALRAAGELGRRDLQAICAQHLEDEDIACRFWAAWSAAVLGERKKSLEVLKAISLAPGAFRERALCLLLKIAPLSESHELLKAVARVPANIRTLIQGAGIVGDPFYAPWLIKQMENPELTRLAGESFSFITGLDLAYLDLDRTPPENVESGPNDDPNDNNVAMDADENLPWPDPKKIQGWWTANEQRFQQGTRYFMGEPVGAEHCRKTLREGCQRQRIAAALYLSLFQPGAPLFPTSAPAWRQQRWLTKMG